MGGFISGPWPWPRHVPCGRFLVATTALLTSARNEKTHRLRGAAVAPVPPAALFQARTHVRTHPPTRTQVRRLIIPGNSDFFFFVSVSSHPLPYNARRWVLQVDPLGETTFAELGSCRNLSYDTVSTTTLPDISCDSAGGQPRCRLSLCLARTVADVRSMPTNMARLPCRDLYRRR